jgi:hypothetical protein
MLCDQTREAYLAQADVPASDSEVVPQLFASLRALVAPRPPPDIGSAPALRSQFAQPEPRPSPAVTATIAVVTAVLIASIGIGTLTLSIILAIALGLAGYFAAGGSIAGFTPVRRARNAGVPLLEEKRPAERMPDMVRLEAALRQADALLALIRNARLIEAAPAATAQFDDRFLAFLQDLAEAASDADGDHLITLTCRRLPSALETIGLHFAALDAENQHVFAVDQLTDAKRKGTAVTVRPAIMQGQRCLSRGYARRYI